MNKIHITAKKDFLESSTTARPLAAIAELVWNGLDAQSDNVNISIDRNGLDGLDTIRIRDFGDGIPHDEVETLFGSLGESWKKKKGRVRGRALHGKNGKGRLKAFSLGTLVEWHTTFRKDGSAFSYRVVGNASSLDDLQFSNPINANGANTGTEVVISNLRHSFGSLVDESAPQEMGRLFAAYLSQYPEISITYDGVRVDPRALQTNNREYSLGEIELGDDRRVAVSVSVIEWKVPTKRVIHLCDTNGVALHDVEAGSQIRAPGFQFTAYIKTDHFRELDKDSLLMLEDMNPDVEIILKAAKSKIREHFRRRLAQQQSQIVQRWKEEHIYPYEEQTIEDPVAEAERQVFDILAVNVESYLPSFEDSDIKSKKFVFRLLAQAVKNNPESVQQIIGEVLNLKKEEQDDLADLIKKTSLSAIISSAKIVANRLDFLIGLENTLFDRETKEKFLERDQLHKILDNEAWLFHEEFTLAGSEQRLEEVLDFHLRQLGPREDDDSQPVLLSDGKQGRIDLMLTKAVQPRYGEFDYLIVELKRPSQKINDKVLAQIEKYAFAVALDPRFQGVNARWTFMVISNELDDYAKRRTNQRGRPRGVTHDDPELNITVIAKSWSEVIEEARTRLQFINSQLAYEADRGSAKDYLQKAHARFIPEIDFDSESSL